MQGSSKSNQLVHFLLRHAAIGIGVSWLTLAGLLATNAGGLYATVAASSNPFLPILLLAFGFAVTFGSAAMCVAVMHLARDLPPGHTPRKQPGFADRVKAWLQPHRMVPKPVRRGTRR